MRDHLALITGHLSRVRLERTMTALGPVSFDWLILDAGVKVAALMTEEIIRRRVTLPEGRSIGETATKFGISETAVRVSLHRGLAAIAKRFGQGRSGRE